MAQAKQTGKKREKEKDKKKKRNEKELRKQERKKNSTKGLGLDVLMASPLVPERATDRIAINLETAAREIASEIRIGKVAYLNMPKGYGFIRDAKVKETLFFGTGGLAWEIKLNDLVTFTRTKTSRGSTAVSIGKLPDERQK